MINSSLLNAKILIVDDQQANIDLITGLLNLKGYLDYKTITDSRKAAALFKEYDPDIILLDLNMPNLSGMQVMAQLKKYISADAFVPILVLTADITPESKQEALAGGAADFLTKPFNLIEVDLRIKNLLKTRYLNQLLNAFNHSLEERIKERTSELKMTNIALNAAKEKAEQSDKLKSEFLAQISHEIRTPLNVLVGNVDYLHEMFNKQINPDTIECFEGIDLAAKRIIRTVDMVLNMADLQIKSYHPIFEIIDLNTKILNKLYQDNKLISVLKGLKLKYFCKERNAYVIADEFSITQIFSNLIDNALKYTTEGEVEIVLEKNKDGNVAVEIKDTGIGISEEFLPRILDPFTQEEHGYSRSFDGNGLGLALVKKYCVLNNITLEIESKKNAGSLFRAVFDKNFAGAANC